MPRRFGPVPHDNAHDRRPPVCLFPHPRRLRLKRKVRRVIHLPGRKLGRLGRAENEGIAGGFWKVGQGEGKGLSIGIEGNALFTEPGQDAGLATRHPLKSQQMARLQKQPDDP